MLAHLRAGLAGLDWPAVVAAARPWVERVRANPAPFWAMESLLREYPISSAEGLALMRLAEALLRVPDAETAIALTADQLGRADFDGAEGDGPHRMLASLSASAIALSKNFLPEAERPAGLMQRLGAKTVVAATVRAMQLLGRQFVLGRTIAEAMSEAAAQRRATPNLRFSYDMLGEGARTDADAQRYLASLPRRDRPPGGAHPRQSPEGGRRHLDQAQRPVSALRGRAARSRDRRTAAAGVEPDRARRRGPTST